MSVGRKLLKGSVFRNIEFFLMVAVTFIMTPFIVHTLGDRLYGFWSLVGTFVGYYGLLDFGITSAIGRFISRGIGRNDYDDVRAVVSTSFVLMLFICALALLLTFASVSFCGYFIDSPEEVSLFRVIITLMGCGIAIGFPARVFGAILSSNFRYDYITLVSIIRILVTNALIYYFLGNGVGLIALTVINVSGNILQSLALALFCYFSYPKIRISLHNFERSKIKILLDYSGKTFVAQLADILRFRVDSFVIAAFLNLNLVTYYSIGARFMDYFVQLVLSVIGVFAPLYSQKEGSGDMEMVRHIYIKATKICVILSVFIGSSIIFYAQPFIICWMGKDFESSYFITIILTVGYITALMQSTSIGLLYGISKHNFFAVANMCEGLCNLILSLILVQYYGIYGVALATTISMMIFKIFIQPVYVCNAIQYSLFNYIRLNLVTLVKVLFPLILYYCIVRKNISEDYFSIAKYAFVQILLFLPIVYYFIFDRDDRRLFIRIIAGKI